jgi:acetylornithine deacetylase/succinyl-diaminopimelate desuccinylase-like protein
MTPLEYLVAHHDRALRELIEFARIPSVSTVPRHRGDIARAAEWVATQLRQAGPIDVRTLPTPGHPVVYGEWLGAPNAPTLLVYGHYDVQPPDPLDKWLSDPFEPEVRDGRLYGRGVSDNKGPMLIPLKVAQAFFATRGALPINVKFIFEGEEEIGSRNLEPFLAANTRLLQADSVLSADGAMWRSDEPSITVASRGVAGLEFSIRGANRNLHSGRYGGSVPNALHAMAELVASLHAPDGRVAIEGFYDSVVPLPEEERRAIAELPFDEARFLAEVGTAAPLGEPGYSTLERQWTRPTLEVNGMWGGYQGQGSQTVTPNEAHAKISCRLVPDQDPDEVRASVVRHLERHLPAGVSLSVHGERHAALAYRIAPDHPGLRTAERVLEQVYGRKALRVRMGSTLPVSELFKRLLGIDTVFFSFSTADEDFHSPNEFFRVHRLHEGLEAWARYWEAHANTIRTASAPRRSRAPVP